MYSIHIYRDTQIHRPIHTYPSVFSRAIALNASRLVHATIVFDVDTAFHFSARERTYCESECVDFGWPAFSTYLQFTQMRI